MSVGIGASGVLSGTPLTPNSGPAGAAAIATTLAGLTQEALDILCPMHVILDPTGHIRHTGPTMQKLRPDTPLAGARFLELFEMSRPRAVDGMASLLRAAGTKLHLRLREHPRTALKAVLIPLSADAAGQRGAIVNFSFGISVVDALQTYSLHSGDFAPTDLTIEMLYLIEAKTAAMEASRKLNMRLQGAKIAAEEQAYTDTLTGLKNRRAMDHVLARLIRTRSQFSLMHLDLDYFKAVNDTHGHRAGDYVLQHVARVLVEETREEDTVARVGGDEFVLLFPRLVKTTRIEEIAHSLIDRLEEPVFFEGAECRVSCSMGTALSHHYAQPKADQMIADADLALYASKNAGRGQHRFFSADLR